jgi:hypothetical protein
VNSLTFRIYCEICIVTEQQKGTRLSNDSWIALLTSDNHNAGDVGLLDFSFELGLFLPDEVQQLPYRLFVIELTTQHMLRKSCNLGVLLLSESRQISHN